MLRSEKQECPGPVQLRPLTKLKGSLGTNGKQHRCRVEALGTPRVPLLAHSSHLLRPVSAWCLTSHPSILRMALRRLFKSTATFTCELTFKNLLSIPISPPLCPTALLVPCSRLALLGASITSDPWSCLRTRLPGQVQVPWLPPSSPSSPQKECAPSLKPGSTCLLPSCHLFTHKNARHKLREERGPLAPHLLSSLASGQLTSLSLCFSPLKMLLTTPISQRP